MCIFTPVTMVSQNTLEINFNMVISAMCEYATCQKLASFYNLSSSHTHWLNSKMVMSLWWSTAIYNLSTWRHALHGLRYFGQFLMRVVHPNILFSPDLKLKKACVLYMSAWYTHRFTAFLVAKYPYPIKDFSRQKSNI